MWVTFAVAAVAFIVAFLQCEAVLVEEPVVPSMRGFECFFQFFFKALIGGEDLARQAVRGSNAS